MGWHISGNQLKAAGEVDEAVGKEQPAENLGWTGYSWNKTLFPYPDQFLTKLHAEGLKATLNLHPASGVRPWEDAYPAMAKAMGIDPASRKAVPFDITDKKFATNYMNLLVAGLAAGTAHQDGGRKPYMVAQLRPLHRSAA
jgi:alpha-glucosidase